MEKQELKFYINQLIDASVEDLQSLKSLRSIIHTLIEERYQFEQEVRTLRSMMDAREVDTEEQPKVIPQITAPTPSKPMQSSEKQSVPLRNTAAGLRERILRDNRMLELNYQVKNQD